MNEEIDKLAAWWWSLTDVDREVVRDKWMEKALSDPEFFHTARWLLDNEKAFEWSPDPKWYVKDD